jgi:hypothetical protein
VSEDSKASTQITQMVEGGTEFKGFRVPPAPGILFEGGQTVPPPPPQARIPTVQSVGERYPSNEPTSTVPTENQLIESPPLDGSKNT